jgi:hypothetical protein
MLGCGRLGQLEAFGERIFLRCGKSAVDDNFVIVLAPEYGRSDPYMAPTAGIEESCGDERERTSR